MLHIFYTFTHSLFNNYKPLFVVLFLILLSYAENLALGKATSQSSTFNNTQSGVSGVSGKAVDGNADTDFNNGHCSHTTNDNPSWWRVDLGSDKVPVSEVLIVNRFSSDPGVQHRNIDYEIALSE